MKKVIVGPETFEWEDDDHSFGTLTAVIKEDENEVQVATEFSGSTKMLHALIISLQKNFDERMSNHLSSMVEGKRVDEILELIMELNKQLEKQEVNAPDAPADCESIYH